LSNIKIEAIRKATHGAGTALVASAVSSIAGFSILYFAPMPVFSAYGLLTAVMIFFALTVSIIVLPSLLMLGTPKIK
jgi:predicted RND superfamily exporter protein